MLMNITSKLSKVTVFAVSMLFFSGSMHAKTWYLDINGTVYMDNEKVDGALATLYTGNARVLKSVTQSNGKFEFRLEPDKDYMISVSKTGCITKRISISTRNVPDERAKYGFSPFRCDVILFPDPKDEAVNTLLSKPVAKVAYMHNQKDFGYDDAYTNAMLTKLEKLLTDIKVVPEPKGFKSSARSMKPGAAEKHKIAGTVVDTESSGAVYVKEETTYANPIGITEEVIVDGNCTILKRVITGNYKTTIYTRKTWAWGGVYYFKDETPITAEEFKMATE